jgi:hypothetical protein
MSSQFHTVYDWASGATWIADGEQPVARLEPPRLRDLVLRPGGPAATWLTLFWWQYTLNETAGRSAWLVDELHLDDHDPACYRLSLRSHNASRSVESRCQLELTYDDSLASYVYQLSLELEVQPGQEWLVQPQGGVEFANPWFRDAVGAALPYPGSSPPRWAWVLYTGPQGSIVRLPLNHLDTSPLGQISFPASGGWLGFFNHPDGNPVIEIGPQAALATRAEVCAWGYDVHFILRIPPQETWPTFEQQMPGSPAGAPSFEPLILPGGQKLSTHYRIYSLSAEEGARRMERSILPSYPPEAIPRLARPAYRAPLNTFSDGVWPQEPDPSWFWSPSHASGLAWDKTLGHSDSASLSIHSQAARLAYWEVPLGPDFWMAPLPASQQRLSGWVRTENAGSPGAYLAFRYSNYQVETGQTPPYEENASLPIVGSQDWTFVELPIEPPPAGATRAYLRLALNGMGDAWFDDVALEPVA